MPLFFRARKPPLWRRLGAFGGIQQDAPGATEASGPLFMDILGTVYFHLAPIAPAAAADALEEASRAGPAVRDGRAAAPAAQPSGHRLMQWGHSREGKYPGRAAAGGWAATKGRGSAGVKMNHRLMQPTRQGSY